MHLSPAACVCICRRPVSAFAVDFDGPALPHGVELTGNIFGMLGRLNLSSLHSNVQHLATTLSGHSPSLVADALCNHPTHVSYSQHEPALSVSIGTNRSSIARALQLRGQAYISRGWAASHLQNDEHAQHASSYDVNLPLLDRVKQQSHSAHCVMLPESGRAALRSTLNVLQAVNFRQPMHHTNTCLATKAFIGNHCVNIHYRV